jgi:hypothetical protein
VTSPGNAQSQDGREGGKARAQLTEAASACPWKLQPRGHSSTRLRIVDSLLLPEA